MSCLLFVQLKMVLENKVWNEKNLPSHIVTSVSVLDHPHKGKEAYPCLTGSKIYFPGSHKWQGGTWSQTPWLLASCSPTRQTIVLCSLTFSWLMVAHQKSSHTSCPVQAAYAKWPKMLKEPEAKETGRQVQLISLQNLIGKVLTESSLGHHTFPPPQTLFYSEK